MITESAVVRSGCQKICPVPPQFQIEMLFLLEFRHQKHFLVLGSLEQNLLENQKAPFGAARSPSILFFLAC